ncbi:hypothetical protein L914_06691 [Phytophthora nicotianae]|uniref:Uncharacterized protein n=1 Tax=Phytophthora nicotianae TaxID=4792 RepID=W2NJS7_PHYNI|nr:hypothetical protein L914_06691 [Phytophthora nicotianae]
MARQRVLVDCLGDGYDDDERSLTHREDSTDDGERVGTISKDSSDDGEEYPTAAGRGTSLSALCMDKYNESK